MDNIDDQSQVPFLQTVLIEASNAVALGDIVYDPEHPKTDFRYVFNRKTKHLTVDLRDAFWNALNEEWAKVYALAILAQMNAEVEQVTIARSDSFKTWDYKLGLND